MVLRKEEMPLTSYPPALSLVSPMLILRKIICAQQTAVSLEFFIENTMFC